VLTDPNPAGEPIHHRKWDSSAVLDLPSVIAGKLPGPLASRYSLNFNP
jgi:hypothetical protein